MVTTSLRPVRSLSGSHCLITGASSGIGAALARRLAQPAGRLTLCGRDPVRLDTISRECEARGATVRILRCDVTDRDRLASGIRDADDADPVDMVIANAGLGGADVIAPSTGESAAAIARTLDVNFLGVINTVTPLLDRFVARRNGSIGIVGSMMAFDGFPEAPGYCASKAAVRVWGHALRRSLKTKGISVTVVSPGFVATPMSASLARRLPFVTDADNAARRILDGMAKGKAEILFPWQLRAAVALGTLLPTGLADRVIQAGTAILARQER
ncbi:MAG: SDR family NAD(P)-dependent oxidoreductase [Hyphomicrobiaceae bacterium]